jgi:hypothetical protein
MIAVPHSMESHIIPQEQVYFSPSQMVLMPEQHVNQIHPIPTAPIVIPRSLMTGSFSGDSSKDLQQVLDVPEVSSPVSDSSPQTESKPKAITLLTELSNGISDMLTSPEISHDEIELPLEQHL